MPIWANALNLKGEERLRFFDLASLTHAPAHLVERFEGLVAENARLKMAINRKKG